MQSCSRTWKQAGGHLKLLQEPWVDYTYIVDTSILAPYSIGFISGIKVHCSAKFQIKLFTCLWFLRMCLYWLRRFFFHTISSRVWSKWKNFLFQSVVISISKIILQQRWQIDLKDSIERDWRKHYTLIVILSCNQKSDSTLGCITAYKVSHCNYFLNPKIHCLWQRGNHLTQWISFPLFFPIFIISPPSLLLLCESFSYFWVFKFHTIWWE